MIPAKPGSSKEGVGGSHKEAQNEFLKAVGLLESRYSFKEVHVVNGRSHGSFKCTGSPVFREGAW